MGAKNPRPVNHDSGEVEWLKNKKEKESDFECSIAVLAGLIKLQYFRNC